MSSRKSNWTTLDGLISALGEDRAAIDAGAQRAIQTTLAYELAQLRKACGLSQVQLAHAAGVDQSRVSRIERGDLNRVEVGTLAAYATALGGRLELNVRIGDVVVPLSAVESDTTSKPRAVPRVRAANERKHAKAR